MAAGLVQGAGEVGNGLFQQALGLRHFKLRASVTRCLRPVRLDVMTFLTQSCAVAGFSLAAECIFMNVVKVGVLERHQMLTAAGTAGLLHEDFAFLLPGESSRHYATFLRPIIISTSSRN